MTAAPGQIVKFDPHGPAHSSQRLRLVELVETAHSSIGRSTLPPLPVSQFQPLMSSVNRSNTASVNSATSNNLSDSAAAVTALRAAADELRSQRDTWLEHCQHETVRLAIAIAERLLRRTLTTQPECVATLVRTALEATAGAQTVRLRLHPADVELLEPHLSSLGGEFSASVELVCDDTLSRGDCVAETTGGSADSRVTTILDRIAEELHDGAV